MSSILNKLLNSEILEPGCYIMDHKSYAMPSEYQYTYIMGQLQTIPNEVDPNIVGMNLNSKTIFCKNQSK